MAVRLLPAIDAAADVQALCVLLCISQGKQYFVQALLDRSFAPNVSAQAAAFQTCQRLSQQCRLLHISLSRNHLSCIDLIDLFVLLNSQLNWSKKSSHVQ